MDTLHMLRAKTLDVAYVAQQVSLFVPASVAQRLLRRVSRMGTAEPDPATAEHLKERFRALLARDLANVHEGLYPESLLFQFPLKRYLKRTPDFVRDLPAITRRRWRADYRRDLPDEAKAYPPYYRRTFHWQTDGYLSRRSARLYDVAVEFLFGGTADVMRRQNLPPIVRYLRAHPEATRVLDVASGTGRTLAQLHEATCESHPAVRFEGLDLSPYYVDEARELLKSTARATFTAGNAEAMPHGDASFDVVTSTYLFHELPRNARRNVMREMVRVLKPGGLMVLQDSAQRSESPEVMFLLERFPAEYHEPFYADYLGDSLEAMAAEVGLVVDSVEPHLVAKVVTARKPLV